MPLSRLLPLLLCLALPIASLGLVGGEHRLQHQTSVSQPVGPRIGVPTQSLPMPVHDETTCPFCQAAIFPPCTPVAAAVPLEYHLTADAQVPHSTPHRLAESRAPPALQIV
jgi:hypothetical protein